MVGSLAPAPVPGKAEGRSPSRVRPSVSGYPARATGQRWVT